MTPCPNCGSDAIVVATDENYDEKYVWCEHCQTAGALHLTKAEALAAWAMPAARKDERAKVLVEVRAMLDELCDPGGDVPYGEALDRLDAWK